MHLEPAERRWSSAALAPLSGVESHQHREVGFRHGEAGGDYRLTFSIAVTR